VGRRFSASLNAKRCRELRSSSIDTDLMSRLKSIWTSCRLSQFCTPERGCDSGIAADLAIH